MASFLRNFYFSHVGPSEPVIFFGPPETGGNQDFFVFLCFFGVQELVFFSGPPKRVKSAIFLILPDPGCPRDLKVGSHTDTVVSWDTVGGI